MTRGSLLICIAFALLVIAATWAVAGAERRRLREEREALLARVRRQRGEYQSAICALSLGERRTALRLLKQENGLSPAQAKAVLRALEELYAAGALAGWDLSIEQVDALDGRAFEQWAARLLAAAGFDQVELTPGSGDQGADILASREGLRYAIQCKHYSRPLGNGPVQEAAAGRAVWGCGGAAVLTNSSFTPGAYVAAEATGVELWDRAELRRLMSRAGIGE